MNKQFEEWLIPKYYNTLIALLPINYTEEDMIDVFNDLPDAFKWGVYLEFFDSVGISISLNGVTSKMFIPEVKWGKNHSTLRNYNTRPEAQQAAIDKAFEIIDGK